MKRIASCMGFVLLGVAAPVAAQELFPTFSARMGGFALSSDTGVGLRAASGRIEGEVDFEDDLGLSSDKTLPTLWLEWQPASRHLFRLGYYEMSRHSRDKVISGEIDLGDTTYPAGAALSAEFEQTVYELDWTWWLVKRERSAFGTELGVTVLELTASAAARVQVGSESRELNERASATAPVPTVGIAGRVQPLSKLWLEAEARVLPGVEFDNVEGDALVLVASAEWQAFEHLNLGVNWSHFELDVDIAEKRYDGSISLETSGVQLYGRVIF
jgi:hypothetical protein